MEVLSASRQGYHRPGVHYSLAMPRATVLQDPSHLPVVGAVSRYVLATYLATEFDSECKNGHPNNSEFP